MKAKLFIATPMYGGMCHGIYTVSLTNLLTLCQREGIPTQLHIIYNESLIQRARNNCAHHFLESDCTHMLFIDSDIGFHPEDALSMLLLLSNETNEFAVLAGVYPKKTIDWDKTLQTALSGHIKSGADLSLAGNQFTFNPIQGIPFAFHPKKPTEVEAAGTGFMMIPRKTLEKNITLYPENTYTQGKQKIHAFFDAGIDPETNLYLAEDYLFCKKVRKAGGKIWILPWIRLIHAGNYPYAGSLSDAAFLMKQ